MTKTEQANKNSKKNKEKEKEMAVKLVKSHEKTVDGECWGSGNVTVHLEEETEEEEVFLPF